MIFFINPLSTLTQSLSQEKALLRAYLGLSQSMAFSPVSNPIAETRFYYNRFLGYLIWHLDNAIAEIEADDENQEQRQHPAVQTETVGPKDYTPEELEARDSLFGDVPTSAPASPETSEVVKVSHSEDSKSFQKLETTTEEIFTELKAESLKERMLGSKNKQELEAFKAEVGDKKAVELWDDLTVIEKNLIKCLSVETPKNKRPAQPFDFITWYDALGQKHDARYVGFYLHGKQVREDERVIYLLKNETFKTVDKRSLKALKNPKPCPAELANKLEKALSTPENTEDTAPTAAEIAALNFTGLAEAPKPPTGSKTGSQPASKASEPSVDQPELPLITERPEPKELPPTPTPALEAIADELKRVNHQAAVTLRFEYETIGKSSFLNIYHGESLVGQFEDDGEHIWDVQSTKLEFHGYRPKHIMNACDKGDSYYEAQKEASKKA